MGRPRPSPEAEFTPVALIYSISKDAAISLMTFEKIGVDIYCQIEYVSSDSDIGMPCGKPAAAPDPGDAGLADHVWSLKELVGSLEREGGSMKQLYNTFRFFLACAIIFGSGYFVAKPRSDADKPFVAFLCTFAVYQLWRGRASTSGLEVDKWNHPISK